MDQETARALFENGAFLILKDVPQGTNFGMDWNSWVTGPNFEGVKMIPPGVHFVFYSAVSNQGGQPAPRTGFFHNFAVREILVYQYSHETEELVKTFPTDAELDSLRLNLKNLDKNLAAYPYDTLKKWVSMSSFITPNLVQKLQPEDGKIRSVLELLPNASSSSQERMAEKPDLDEDGLPNLKVNPSSVINFSSIPEKWYPDGASPSEMSKHSMDSSYILETLFGNYESPNDILGEMQFAFVCFILGQVFDSFEHWKNLTRVLCMCEGALNNYLDLYKSLVGVLYHQIDEIPVDFFVDIVSSNNFLVSTLSRLFCNIQLSCYNEELQTRAKQFRKHLTKKYKWKLNQDPDDWAPVVVEI